MLNLLDGCNLHWRRKKKGGEDATSVGLFLLSLEWTGKHYTEEETGTESASSRRPNSVI